MNTHYEKKNYKIIIFFLALVINLLPFIHYYSFNILVFDNIALKSLTSIYISVVLILVVSSFICSYLLKIVFNKVFILFSIFFYIWFYLFKNIYSNNFQSVLEFRGEITLIICIIISVFFTFFLFKNYRKTLIFLLTYSTLIILLEFFNIYDYEKRNFFSNGEKNYFKSLKEFNPKSLKKIKNNNFYLIIYDGAMSTKKFEKMFNTEIENTILEEISNDYLVINNFLPLATTTQIILGKILLLDESSFDDKKKLNRHLLFPNIIMKEVYGKTPFKKVLYANGYSLKWFGNAIYNCKLYNSSLCYEDNNSTLNVFNKFYSVSLSKTFFQFTFIDLLFKKANYLIAKHIMPSNKDEVLNITKRFEYKKNHPSKIIIKLLENNKMSKNNLFLIHNYFPKSPFNYLSTCEYSSGSTIKQLVEHNNGYYNNYLCMIKSLKEIVNKIEETDPFSKVLIISDHGINWNEKSKKPYIDINQNVLAIVKINENCKPGIDEKLNKENYISLIKHLIEC